MSIATSATLKIFCGVKVGAGSNAGCTVGGAAKTYVTAGGTALTSPDCVSGTAGCTAQPSQITHSSGDQAVTLNLPSPIVVTPGSAKQANVFFSSTAACELWDISVLLGHAVGTDFKIVPKSQSASRAEAP